MAKIERFTGSIPMEKFLEHYYRPEVVGQKCRECSGCATTWSCPPFDFDQREFWEQFREYEIMCDRIWLEGAESPEAAEKMLYAQKPIFNEEMLAREHDLIASGVGATALYAEECEECAKCARLIGKPCRLPERMRYSVESMGGLAVKLIEDHFGFSVQWSDGTSIPPYYVLLGGILLK